jgi:hypothetical protein
MLGGQKDGGQETQQPEQRLTAAAAAADTPGAAAEAAANVVPIASGSGQQTKFVLASENVNGDSNEAPGGDDRGEEVRRRVRDYLDTHNMERKKQEIFTAIGDNMLAYNAVKTANTASLHTVDLKSRSKVPVDIGGDLVAGLDGRMRVVDLNVVLGQKKTWTYSFDGQTLLCKNCPQHGDVVNFPQRGFGGKGCRQVIFLADQSMPPSLPASNKQCCVKIVWTILTIRYIAYVSLPN